MHEFYNGHGQVWKHKRKGTQYVIMFTCDMLTDSHWVKAVTYHTQQDAQQVFTRTLESFREKFERVA